MKPKIRYHQSLASQPIYATSQPIYAAMSNQAYGLNSLTSSGPFIDEEAPQSLIDLQILTVAEAKKLLLPILKTGIVPFLWGPPGVGKSTLVKEIAQEEGWDLIDLRLSLLNPVDLRGLPVIDKENQLADWYPPAFLPKKNTKKKGILFLDEINLAPASVQHAAYQLILDKKVGEYEFPASWMIVAAGNRETDRANVTSLSAPLANRFVHFTIKEDFYTWSEWAQEHGIRKEIIDFLTMQPKYLLKMPQDKQKAFPSPRTWEFCSNLMNAFGWNSGMKITPPMQSVVIGAVGDTVAQDFFKFLSSYDIQAVEAKVLDFIQNGKLNFPTKTAEKYAFSGAIYEAHKAGKIPEERYQLFLNKLQGEDRATIFTVMHEHLTGADEAYTFNIKLITPQSSTIHVDSVTLFKDGGGSAEIVTSGHRELIKYSGIDKKSKTLTGITRGFNKTIVETFAEGSVIRPL